MSKRIAAPLTIEVQAAESEEVLFCRVYVSTELIFAPWDDHTNWKLAAKRAIANVEAAVGNSLKKELSNGVTSKN